MLQDLFDAVHAVSQQLIAVVKCMPRLADPGTKAQMAALSVRPCVTLCLLKHMKQHMPLITDAPVQVCKKVCAGPTWHASMLLLKSWLSLQMLQVVSQCFKDDGSTVFMSFVCHAAKPAG